MATAPFLSFYTPTFRRPTLLANCLASVGAQSIVADIEHFVIPDHVGRGIHGMYAAIPQYAAVVRGEYVHVLADDDTLAGPRVVEDVRTLAVAHAQPEVIVVGVMKRHLQGWLRLPLDVQGPPVEGRIDLGCLIVRRDVWQAHAHDWGKRYQGDFDFAAALWQAGHRFVYAPDLLFLQGAVMHGQPEVACTT